jgi:hypothetical protein
MFFVSDSIIQPSIYSTCALLRVDGETFKAFFFFFFLFFFRMQVALKYMPVQSRIVGVDLVPINHIPGTTSFVGDITSAETRKELNRIFEKQKVDVVLHDGAPNMGTNWDYDAYQQNELTLK